MGFVWFGLVLLYCGVGDRTQDHISSPSVVKIHFEIISDLQRNSKHSTKSFTYSSPSFPKCCICYCIFTTVSSSLSVSVSLLLSLYTHTHTHTYTHTHTHTLYIHTNL
jgi:hypothetical protein